MTTPQGAIVGAPQPVPPQPLDEGERRRRRKLIVLLVLGALMIIVLLLFGWYLLFRQPISELLPPTERFAMPKYQWAAYGIIKPVSVAVAPDGSRIYVTESDGPQETLILDNHGNRLGVLKPPAEVISRASQLYVAVDPSNGDVYATDRAASQVRVYGADGTYKRLLDPGKAIGAWQPLAVTIDRQGHVFVADAAGAYQRVHEFDRDGTFVRSFGSEGTFEFPNGLAVDQAENLYVSDTSHGRLVVFAPTGEQLGLVKRGQLDENLAQPRGVAIDQKDRVHVVDAVAQSVAVYVAIVKGAAAPRYIDRFGIEGIGNGAFEYPNGIAVDDRSRIYVADWNNDRVQVWSY